MGNRFDCVLDPFNRFEIWDHEHCSPVMRHGRLLSYATRCRAERVTTLLNLAADRCRHTPIFRQPLCGDGHIRRSLVAARSAEPRRSTSVDTE